MKKMKRLGFLISALVLVCALGFTLAYFTDRVTATGSISTAPNSVDIDVTKPDDPNEPDPGNPTDPDYPIDPWVDPTPDNDHDDLQNWWTELNATALANFNPGDKLCLDAKIINNGTLAIEYRETFVITVKPVSDSTPLNGTNPEFRLFSNCTKASSGAITGGTPVSVESIDTANKKITYVTAKADLAAGGSVTTNYDLVFALAASNAYQGAQVTVDYILEACQDGVDWAEVTTASITTGSGNSYDVLPAA